MLSDRHRPKHPHYKNNDDEDDVLPGLKAGYRDYERDGVVWTSNISHIANYHFT